jgi:hypothetical protein
MSGRLVKLDGNDLHVAQVGVYGPGYKILVSDAQSAHGWTFYEDDVEREDFALPWVQPTGEDDSYALGTIVSHGGKVWRSLLAHNVWEPGVSGWREAADDFTEWLQPTGAHDAYAANEVVSHGGKVWRSLIDANAHEPGVSGWRESVLMPPSGEVPPPAWVQPAGGHDAYNTGDRVTHNGQVWMSTVDANVWEPGTVGTEALWQAE